MWTAANCCFPGQSRFARCLATARCRRLSPRSGTWRARGPSACKIRPDCRLPSLTWALRQWWVRRDRSVSVPVVVSPGGQQSRIRPLRPEAKERCELPELQYAGPGNDRLSTFAGVHCWRRRLSLGVTRPLFTPYCRLRALWNLCARSSRRSCRDQGVAPPGRRPSCPARAMLS